MSNMKTQPGISRRAGFSLVELMIAIAIVAILSSIAIPLYNGYVREGHFTALRANMPGLRTVIEDFRLDNGSYGATGNLVGLAAIDARYGWEPGSDISQYTYTVAVVGTNDYDVWGVFSPDIWVRCEERMNRCCDSGTSGATAANAACP